MTTITLRTEGPHSPEYTQEVGNALAECVRVLNYATNGMPGGGLECPGDVYTLLGALYTATGRLSQLLAQIASFLVLQAANPRLADSRGEMSWELVLDASYELREEATHHAAGLTAALQNAQNAISGLYVKDPGTVTEGTGEER